MDAKQRRLRKQGIAERSKVRAVAERPRDDRNELPIGIQQANRKRDEGSVEICCIEADALHQTTLARCRADLSVGGVHDCRVETADRRREERPLQAAHGGFEEVLVAHVPGEIDAAGPARSLAARISLPEMRRKDIVDFECCRHDRQNPPACTRLSHKSRRESSYARTRIKQPDLLRQLSEHAGHEAGNWSRREELT